MQGGIFIPATAGPRRDRTARCEALYDAEGSFDRLKKRALALMAKNGGTIDRSTLLQNMHVDAMTLKKVIATLCLCDLVESEMVSNGKVLYSIRKAA